PPSLPPRADLYDEVAWGQHVTENDARIAHRFWSCADQVLRQELIQLEGNEKPFLYAENTEEKEAMPMHALAHNVYEHLMRQHLLPPEPTESETAGMDHSWVDHSWSFEEIFLETDVPRWTFFEQKAPQLLKSNQLKAALNERGLDDRGTVAVLRERLEKYQTEGPKCYRALRRSDLSHWGIDRTNVRRQFTINISENEEARTLDMYTCAILRSPYNPAYWLSRAYCHYRHCIFDLALGDAYRAQLLIEVLVNPLRRNMQPGLYTLIWHAIEHHIMVGGNATEIKWLRAGNGVNYFVPTMRKALQNIIGLSLIALQCWHDRFHFEQDLMNKVIMKERDAQPFKRRLKVNINSWVRAQEVSRGVSRNYLYYERFNGWNHGGRPYPYEADDTIRLPRIGEGLAEKATELFVTKNTSLPWKKCKIAMEREQRYMMIATEDIAEDELIWVEIPSARGHLTTKRPRLPEGHTPEKRMTCDNCQRRRQSVNPLDRENRNSKEACPCIDKTPPLIFCPARGEEGDETCAENARRRYHFKACGKDWEWLHDAMRPVVYDFNVRVQWLSHSNEKHGTVLSLLLREILDITLLRRQTSPGLQAHEIDELLALEGRADWKEQNFPFSFAANIQVPCDILLKLGVDIFRDLSLDTWVIQLVLQKLLVNAVPWDEDLRSKTPRTDKTKRYWIFPRPSTQKNWPEAKYAVYDPSCRFIYLFPGFSFFDHACKENTNAQWGYDTEVPNRLLVWATKPIKAGEEIRISYISDEDKDEREYVLQRVLGKPCNCPGPEHGVPQHPESPYPPIPGP
ncbi:uncharacterized protein BP01DRAFT_275759, partial [Aspergillus saccharolyticus JOP 1030-1]